MRKLNLHKKCLITYRNAFTKYFRITVKNNCVKFDKNVGENRYVNNYLFYINSIHIKFTTQMYRKITILLKLNNKFKKISGVN